MRTGSTPGLKDARWRVYWILGGLVGVLAVSCF